MRQTLSSIIVIVSAACLWPAPGCANSPAAPVAGAQASPSVKSRLERAYVMKSEGRASDAIAAFQGVLKQDPGNQAALSELGYLHAGLKQHQASVKYLRAASAQDPGNMRLHMDLGYAYQALKQLKQAEGQFKMVVESSGDFEAQAQEALRQVAAPAAAGPRPGLRQQRLREAGYAALGRGDRAAARKAFQAAAANDPKDVASLKQLGFINLSDGNLSAAAADFEAIRALDPADYFIALQLGYTYDKLKKREQAREAFGAALASDDAKIHAAAKAALQAPGIAEAPDSGSAL